MLILNLVDKKQWKNLNSSKIQQKMTIQIGDWTSSDVGEHGSKVDKNVNDGKSFLAETSVHGLKYIEKGNKYLIIKLIQYNARFLVAGNLECFGLLLPPLHSYVESFSFIRYLTNSMTLLQRTS